MQELEQIVLKTSLPRHGLVAGDVGTIVFVHDEGKAYEVEFLTQGGHTVAVVTLDAGDVRLMAADDLLHVRSVAE